MCNFVIRIFPLALCSQYRSAAIWYKPALRNKAMAILMQWGGEGGQFKRLIKSLLVSVQGLIFGYSGKSWMWVRKAWLAGVCGSRQDLLWLVNDPIAAIITSWTAPCISPDDLGMRINGGHLPLQTGPHKRKSSSREIIFQNKKISSEPGTETNKINLYRIIKSESSQE